MDAFKIHLYEGGTVDLSFRVSTSDIDRLGVGILWAFQKRGVVVMVTAPKAPAPTIDGSNEAFAKDHPGAAKAQPDLLDVDPPRQPDAGEAFAAAHSEADRGDGKDWPFPGGDDAGAGQAEAAAPAVQPASRSTKGKRGAAPE